MVYLVVVSVVGVGAKRVNIGEGAHGGNKSLVVVLVPFLAKDVIACSGVRGCVCGVDVVVVLGRVDVGAKVGG